MIPTLRLPCGAALAAETAEGARSFAAGFWFPIGSRHEAPRERGFVHFVEHMTFKGTAGRSAAEISREIDRVGGYLNAFTDRDSICIHCQVPAAHWRLALDVLCDMALGSVFRVEDFEREREVIVSEILSASDDPEECSHDRFLSAIWPGDPLSRKIAGEPGEIRRITRDALYAFYKAEFSPSRLLVTASGPVSAAKVGEELSRLVDPGPGTPGPGTPGPGTPGPGTPGPGTPGPGTPGPGTPGAGLPADRRGETTPAFSPGWGYVRSGMEQVHFYEAVQLEPLFSEDDYFSLSALNGALGEASSSRLFLSLREDQGLCYSVYSAFAMTRTECLWMASANVSPAQLPTLASEMDRLIDEASEGGLRDEECADAVARLSGSFELSLDDTDFRMRRIAREILFAGEAMTIDEARDRIARLGPSEINAMCFRLLRGRRRARFAYGELSSRTARAIGLSNAQAAARRG